MATLDALNLTGTDGAVRVAIRVMPRAGRNALDGVTETGALRIRLTAPPVEGAANAALVTFLAMVIGIPKRSITLVRGTRGRDKVVEIAAPLAIIQERLRAVGDQQQPGSDAATPPA
ncbi:MAG: DUF167 domain-containing protein [Thermomicrobiales bacterium]